jgi:hypothetical protein
MAMSSDPTPDLVGRNEGEHRRDESCDHTNRAHRRQVLEYQRAFLEAVLQNGSATADDAAHDLALRYADGGKWVGAATQELARAGVIVRVEVTHSCRTPRHAGLLWRWRAASEGTARLVLGLLRLQLAVLPPEWPVPQQLDRF